MSNLTLQDIFYFLGSVALVIFIAIGIMTVVLVIKIKRAAHAVTLNLKNKLMSSEIIKEKVKIFILKSIFGGEKKGGETNGL